MNTVPAITYIDTTLRDGSHAIEHSLVPKAVREVVAELSRAGVAFAELGHGAGLGGSSAQHGFAAHSNEELFAAAREVAGDTVLTALLVPGIGVMDDLRRAVDAGIGAVRVAVHVTEADVGLQHIELGRDLGLKVFGFIMMAHMASPEKIAEQASMLQGAGAEVVYLADSAGYMMNEDVRRRVQTLKHALDVPIGFHAHNNLGLAVSNSLVAVESGATWIDGTLGGLGAGAGNLQGEVFAVVAERLGIELGLTSSVLIDAAANLVTPLMRHPQIIDRTSLIIGFAGVYSSFLHKADKVAKAYGVDAAEILIEAGRRGTVGGQEDVLEKIAMEMTENVK